MCPHPLFFYKTRQQAGFIAAAYPKFACLATTMSNNNPNELDMDQFDAITMELANAATSTTTTGDANSSGNGNRVAETVLGSGSAYIVNHHAGAAEIDLDAVGTDESEEEIDLDAYTAGGSLPAEG